VPALYSRKFYTARQDGSAGSAQVIVPLLLSTFPARSAVDVGCGTGVWLKVLERHGVVEYLGIDGDHVPPDMLQIHRRRFVAADLKRPEPIERRFDIACSLEVAEHLPEDCAAPFVAFLTALAPVVLFSAAIPHQGGTGHVNEQWQSYWSDLFRAKGYAAIDCIRPAIYGDRRVDWWYRQNVIVYCDEDHRPRDYAPMSEPSQLNRADPEMIELLAAGPADLRTAIYGIRHDVVALSRALCRKMFGRI